MTECITPLADARASSPIFALVFVLGGAYGAASVAIGVGIGKRHREKPHVQ
jgi:hypothetical protein